MSCRDADRMSAENDMSQGEPMEKFYLEAPGISREKEAFDYIRELPG